MSGSRYVTRPLGPPTMLSLEFMPEHGFSEAEVARRMGVPLAMVQRLISGEQRVTSELAAKLSQVFGTTPDFWLNAQRSLDTFDAERRSEE